MHLTLCTGMMRSGSTWSFNVARLVGQLQAQQLGLPMGSEYLDCHFLDRFIDRHFNNDAIVIIKVHSPAEGALELIKSGHVKNICTFRDPRDCVASRQRFENEPFEKSIQFITSNLKYINLYKQLGHTLFIRYEDMKKDELGHIKLIGNFMGTPLSDKQIQAIHGRTNADAIRSIANSLSEKSDKEVLRDRSHRVDKVTHVHQNHVTDGRSGAWQEQLSKDEVQRVNSAFEKNLTFLGYEI